MATGEIKALSVTQLVRRMRNVLEIEVGECWVEGEVSNLRKQASGHWYFSLKDDSAQISCAMFSAKRREGSAALEDGAKVRVFGEATVYEARGQLQLVVQKAEAAGAGELQAKFEALKKKLDEEGLFAAERKQELPFSPRTIGLVTSPTGAAIRDMLNVLERRAPWVTVVLAPVRVQGKGAEAEIAAAIARMGDPEKHGVPRCDLLIVGRGGGSLEDLWNFNEELVARAIAACPIPVISAVGHEIDFTIADFVADVRAPTPSAAAELAVPDRAELRERVHGLKRRLVRRAGGQVERLATLLDGFRRGVLGRSAEALLREPVMRVDALRSGISAAARGALAERVARCRQLAVQHRAHHPARQVERRGEMLAELSRRLAGAAEVRIEQEAEHLKGLKGLLRTLGPESAFQRGFSITMNEKGKVLRSKEDVESGETIRTRLSDGELSSRVD
jgi:exodeoxyribonuclease VII large subunit